MRIIFIAVAVAILAGCATRTWWSYPPGGTEAQFNQDTYECMQQAQQQTSNAYVNPYGGAAQSGTTTNMTLAKLCMRARGYTETSGPNN